MRCHPLHTLAQSLSPLSPIWEKSQGGQGQSKVSIIFRLTQGTSGQPSSTCTPPPEGHRAESSLLELACSASLHSTSVYHLSLVVGENIISYLKRILKNEENFCAQTRQGWSFSVGNFIIKDRKESLCLENYNQIKHFKCMLEINGCEHTRGSVGGSALQNVTFQTNVRYFHYHVSHRAGKDQMRQCM